MLSGPRSVIVIIALATCHQSEIMKNHKVPTVGPNSHQDVIQVDKVCRMSYIVTRSPLSAETTARHFEDQKHVVGQLFKIKIQMQHTVSASSGPGQSIYYSKRCTV